MTAAKKKPDLGAAMTKAHGQAGPEEVKRRAESLAALCKALGVSSGAVTDAQNLDTFNARSPEVALAELEQVAGVLESIAAAEQRLPARFAAAAQKEKAKLLQNYPSKKLWFAGAVKYVECLLKTVAEHSTPQWKSAEPSRRRAGAPPSGS